MHKFTLKERAYKLIEEHRAAALATSDQICMPHVATVYCVPNKDLSVYFSSRIEGRKLKNLLANPNVAMAFTDETKLRTIQLTGFAEQIEDLYLEQEILHKLMTMRYQDPNWPVPPMQLFEKGYSSQVAIIKVTPTEMTYANFENPQALGRKSFFQKVI
jgi:nitroimidazol reductase NimA-like FMN-containing flavoprotein (pyridoxamine 5'-phosphate oxidase superfamily)